MTTYLSYVLYYRSQTTGDTGPTVIHFIFFCVVPIATNCDGCVCSFTCCAFVGTKLLQINHVISICNRAPLTTSLVGACINQHTPCLLYCAGQAINHSLARSGNQSSSLLLVPKNTYSRQEFIVDRSIVGLFGKTRTPWDARIACGASSGSLRHGLWQRCPSRRRRTHVHERPPPFERSPVAIRSVRRRSLLPPRRTMMPVLAAAEAPPETIPRTTSRGSRNCERGCANGPKQALARD